MIRETLVTAILTLFAVATFSMNGNVTAQEKQNRCYEECQSYCASRGKMPDSPCYRDCAGRPTCSAPSQPKQGSGKKKTTGDVCLNCTPRPT